MKPEDHYFWFKKKFEGIRFDTIAYAVQKYLEDLLLVDLTDSDPEDELEYNFENAHSLVSNSTEFDNWVRGLSS